MLETFVASDLASLVVAIVTFVVVYHWWTQSPWKLPPGPPRLPIVGTLPFMTGDIRVVFKKMAQKYGDIFTVYMGAERVIIINGYDTIKTCLTKTGGVFDGRPEKIWKDFTKLQGVISSDGELWKEHRRYLLHILRDFGLGKRSMEELIIEEVDHLTEEIHKCSYIVSNLQGLLEKTTFNVIGWIAFGRRLQYNDPLLASYMTQMKDVMNLVGANNPSLVFDLLRHIPGDPFKYHQALGARRKLDNVFKGWIKEHKSKLAAGEGPTDVIGMYLQEAEKRKGQENNTFDDAQLLEIIADMFFAGTDTTSTTLSWAFLYMILNPDIQSKVQDEIDRITEGAGSPTTTDRQHMPYTEAVLSEVMRICDLLPLSVPHATRSDVRIHDYTIPAGTMVLVNQTSILMDPQIWPEPNKFDPERFLTRDGKYRKKNEFVPFSMGKRMCLGASLARMELFIVFTHLLQQFTLKSAPGQPTPNVNDGILGVTHSPKHYGILAVLRRVSSE